MPELLLPTAVMQSVSLRSNYWVLRFGVDGSIIDSGSLWEEYFMEDVLWKFDQKGGKFY